MNEMVYTYSQLSSDSVANLVAKHYELPAPIRCKFYILGLHDNYLIECDNSKFILRIYRNEWRSQEEVYFELELLAFLNGKSEMVAVPLLTKSDELTFFVDSPEGKRAVALFNYADGHAPGKDISIDECGLLGSTVAKTHQLLDNFKPSYIRAVLDIPYLVDESIISVKPFLDSDSVTYLETLQTKLHHMLPVLEREARIYGLCIGDVNPTNFHINEKMQITLFDFDQCGYGYRAFEIGKFVSSIDQLKMKHEMVKSFIDGYKQVRQLSNDELQSIPCFELVSMIWVMAIHANNVNRIGYKHLEKPFWDKRLDRLKELERLSL